MSHGDQRPDPAKKRRHLRYRPDQISTAKVQLYAESSSFQPELSALVYEEAYGGCCIVLITDKAPTVHDRWRIQVGQLHPMVAEVVWFKKFEDYVWKVGLKFLE